MMEEDEKIVHWIPNPHQRRPIPKLLPDDWVLEYEVKIPDPSGNSRGLKFVFEEVLTVRVANDALCEKLVALSGDPVWRTFKVEGSDWLKSFIQMDDYETYQDCQIEHFIFVSDIVVEVLAAGEPRFEEIALPSSFRTKW